MAFDIFGRGLASAAIGAQTGAIKGEAEAYRRQQADLLRQLRLAQIKPPKDEIPYDIKSIIDVGDKIYTTGTAEEKKQFEDSGMGAQYRATRSLLGAGLGYPAVRAGIGVVGAGTPEEAGPAVTRFSGLVGDTTPYSFISPKFNPKYNWTPSAKEQAQTADITANTAATVAKTPYEVQDLQEKILNAQHGRTLDEKQFNLKAATQDFANALAAFKARHGAGEDDLHDKIKIAQYLLQGARAFQGAGAIQNKALQSLLRNNIGLGITTINPAVASQMLRQAGYDDNFIQRVLQGANAGTPAAEGGSSPGLQQNFPASVGTGTDFSGVTLHGNKQPIHMSPNQIPGHPPVLNQVPGAPGVQGAVGPINTAGVAGAPPPATGLSAAPINTGVVPGAPAAVNQPNPLAQAGLVMPATAPPIQVNYPDGSLERRIGDLYVRGTLSGDQIVNSFPHGSPEQAAAYRVISELNSQLYRNQFAGLPSAETNGAMLPGNTNFAGALGYQDVGIPQIPLNPLIPNVGFLGQPAALAPQQPAGGGVWNDANNPPLNTLPQGGPAPAPSGNSYVPPAPSVKLPSLVGKGRSSVLGVTTRSGKPGPPVMGVTKAPNEKLAKVPPPKMQGEVKAASNPFDNLTDAQKKSVAQDLSQLRRSPWAPSVNRWLRAQGSVDPLTEATWRHWVEDKAIPALRKQGWGDKQIKAGLYDKLVEYSNGNPRIARH